MLQNGRETSPGSAGMVNSKISAAVFVLIGW